MRTNYLVLLLSLPAILFCSSCDTDEKEQVEHV